MSGEETEAERRVREQAEAAAAEAGRSILSWLNPFNWGFGGMLMLLLVGGALYYFGATERGREMLGNAFEGLSPEWQERLAGWGASLGLLPDGVSDAISEDPQALTRVMAIARGHGVSLTAGAEGVLSNPDLMYDLMTQEPAFVLRTARGMSGGDEANEHLPRAMASMRQIVNNPQRLAALLGPQHKANTYALLEAFSPVPFPPGQLGTFIDTVGLQNNGQPTAEFTQFLNAMLADTEGTTEARMNAILEFVGRHPQDVQRLLEGIDPATITDPELSAQITAVTEQPAAALAPAARVVQRMGENGAEILEQMASSPTNMVRTLLDPEKRAAIFVDGNASDIATTMSAKYADLAARLPTITDRAEREEAQTQMNLYRLLGTINRNDRRPVNVEAVQTFFNTIATNSYNNRDRVAMQRTDSVMVGMVRLMSGEEGAAAQMDAEQVAAFFNNDTNSQAFGRFFRDLNPTLLPNTRGNNLRGLVTTFESEWGDRTRGMADVLDDPASVRIFLNGASNPNAAPTRVINEMDGFSQWMAREIIPTRFSDVTQEMANNFTALGNIQQALINAGVTPTPPQAPAPNTAITATGNMR